MNTLPRWSLRRQARTSGLAADAARVARSSTGRAVAEGGWLLARAVGISTAVLWGLSRI